MKKKDPSSGFSTESKCASYAGFIKQFKKNSKINSIVSGEISEVENWVFLTALSLTDIVPAHRAPSRL